MKKCSSKECDSTILFGNSWNFISHPVQSPSSKSLSWSLHEEQNGTFPCPPYSSPGHCKLKASSIVTYPLVLVLTKMPFTISLLPFLWSLKVAHGCSLGPKLCNSLFCVVRDPANMRGATVWKMLSKTSLAFLPNVQYWNCLWSLNDINISYHPPLRQLTCWWRTHPGEGWRKWFPRVGLGRWRHRSIGTL